MGSLKSQSGYKFEATTATLSPDEWWAVLRALVGSLDASGVREVDLEYGFVLERDIKGRPQGTDARVPLEGLELAVRRGIKEGTIERVGSSDFCFHAVGRRIGIMLCNDADIHVGADDAPTIERLADVLRDAGVVVHGPN